MAELPQRGVRILGVADIDLQRAVQVVGVRRLHPIDLDVGPLRIAWKPDPIEVRDIAFQISPDAVLKWLCQTLGLLKTKSRRCRRQRRARARRSCLEILAQLAGPLRAGDQSRI